MLRFFSGLVLAGVLVVGCSNHSTKPASESMVAQVKLTTQEQTLVKRYRDLTPDGQKAVIKTVAKQETRQEREGEWGQRLMILGIGLGSIGLIALGLKLAGVL